MINANTKRALCVLAITLVTPCVAQPQASNPFENWRQLFNGKNLDGWKLIGEGQMRVENGAIKAGGEGTGLLYWTGGKIGNCVLHVVYQMQHDNDNSGVFIRIPIEPREEEMPINYGYEINIDDHPERWGEDDYYVTGTLYSFTRALAKPGKRGPQWNTMDVTLNGSHTVVVLNGIKVTDYTEGDPLRERRPKVDSERGARPNEGWIGLQGYSEKEIVFFKEVAVRPLLKK